ncbi:MAG: O-antigen ligase family protein, partial [Propionibacterium sp.]|nr:O-antigen ligase family protein [Propionibacterium sp.]
SLFRGLSADPSIQGRTDDYPLVLRAVQENPLFGQGLYTWVPMVYRTIDNQVLMMLIELGVIGTFAIGCLVLTGFVLALSPWRRHGSSEQRHLGLAIAAALLGIVSSYATFDAFGFRQVAGLTFLYIGLSGAVWWVSRAPAPPQPVNATTSAEFSPAASQPSKPGAAPSRDG